MASTTEGPGRRPEKRPHGRPAPPPGYPKDRELYADPENLLYPVNTPVRARLARRYFDDEKNRSKYTEEEQQYIDAKINDALRRFGFAVTEEGARNTAQRTRKASAEISPSDLEDASTEEILIYFLGKARLERAQAIDSSLVNIKSITGDTLSARVKDYTVEINIPEHYIEHNCPDWENWSEQKMMCKHIGKVFLSLDEKISTPLLKKIYAEKDTWQFRKGSS
jgi:uncharacterized protein DUF6582